MNVPFVDLGRTNGPLQQKFHDVLAHVMSQDSLILGKAVADFERDFASYTGTKHAIGVNSGADALEIIMRCCGIGPGDDVIVPANSFAATATAVSLTGARPVFCDVEPNALVSLKKIQQVMTPQTRMIIAVHLYGQCVDMDEILDWARPQKIAVIEDACQAHGSTYKGRRAGSLADAAAFSFYPTKNLGALGDAGAITTDSDDIVQKANLWRNYGSSQKYHHEISGKNARLDTLQAAFLSAKLPFLESAIASRRYAAQRYLQGLQGLPFTMPAPDSLASHSFHLFVIDLLDTSEREPLMNHLTQSGVQSLIHYPIPIHRQAAYAAQHRVVLPEVERLCDSVLSLPVFAGITDAELDYAIDALRRFWHKKI